MAMRPKAKISKAEKMKEILKDPWKRWREKPGVTVKEQIVRRSR